MFRFALSQLVSDLGSSSYFLEHSSHYGVENLRPVDYLVFHPGMDFPLGRLTQRGPNAPMKYDPFPHDDVEASYHSEQAFAIINARLRLVHAE